MLTKFPYSVTSQVSGQRYSPPTWNDRGCDTVLPDLSYRTHRAAVMYEYGTVTF
jgi:hypothetical protein